VQRLTCQFAEIRAVLDCPAVHNLCLDVWLMALDRGEAWGVEQAVALKKWIAEYVAAGGPSEVPNPLAVTTEAPAAEPKRGPKMRFWSDDRKFPRR
jgi:hypothetical protein